MSYQTHKTRENLIKTLFKAVKVSFRRFDSGSVLTLGFIIVFVATLYAVSTFVLAKKPNEFRPETESLHVFASVVQSDDWFNIQTLGIQDLDEDALYQSFDEENSAYIDPSGKLPSDIFVEQFERSSSSQESQTAPSEPSQPEEKQSASSTESSKSILDIGTEFSDENVEVDSEIVDEGDDESNPVENNQIEEPIEESVEPEPEPEPLPELEQASEETAGMTGALYSLFKQAVGSFAFTQAVTTTPVISEDIEEPALLPEETVELPELPVSSEREEPQVEGAATTSEEVVDLSLETESSTTTGTKQVSESQTQSQHSSYEITLKDFGVPELESGQFINNLQLRLSLGGQYEIDASSSIPALSASYTFGEFGGDAGSILIEEEVSNAVNGGYYLIPLPSVTDPSILSDLEITLSFNGELDRLASLYLDAVWLEVGTVVFDIEKLKGRTAPQNLAHLRAPNKMEFMGARLDFMRNELPQFSLRYNSQRNFAVRAMRSVFGKELAAVTDVRFLHGGLALAPIKPDVTVTAEGLITILVSEEEKKKLKPGLYTVEVEVDEGGYVSVDSFDFQWGILSINPNQTEYQGGDIATISMGALSPNGNTVCDANLDLYIIDPRGFISKSPVIPSGECFGNNVTNVPDYSAQFVTDISGEYEMYLERLDESGSVIGHTSDTFFVKNKQEYAIERTGPTRIYPPSPYAMEITVHAKESSFSGQLIERLPRDFDVFNTDATINRYADFTELVWDVTALASTSETYSYEFDAPDLSPYLYMLGPARLESDKKNNSGTTTASSTQRAGNGNIAFEEHREWQIASDATGNMILYWDGATIPTGWTCLSCGSGTFYQRFGVGSSTYNSTGGNATHSHTGTGSVNTSADSDAENFGSGTVAGVSHTHTYTPTIASTSSLPLYRQLRVIQYTSAAGEPANIPAGAIGIFDVASSSLPTDWYRYDAQDGYYVRGEDTAGTTGGGNTHQHDITGTTGAAGGSTEGARAGTPDGDGAAASHTHTVSTTTSALTNEPPYIEVVLAQLSATSAPPNSLITMWTEDVPSGWLDVSSDGGDPFNNRFIKASTTYGGTGGANTHSISNISGIISSGPSGANTDTRAGAFGAAYTHTHTVSVNSISTENHLPPYVSTVFGKRQGTNPVYTQATFRWYTNANAEPPTDPWPSGAENLLVGEDIGTSTTLMKNDDLVRLRMNVSVENATATAGTRYKLQYAAANSCSSGTWSDVGDTSSSTVWRGFDNSSITDHATLSSTTLSSTTIASTYEENGYATNTPSDIGVDDFGEWDYVLEHNGALAGTNYCFRMVEEDGTAFFSYADYPEIYTNTKPDAPTPLTLFDNEKTPTTTPSFTFVASDSESEDLHYQIQIDDDFSFGSNEVDEDTFTNTTDFSNLVDEADKAPYSHGEEMQFDTPTTLSNGTTYWWRVRAQDVGSDEWSDWSTARSFTIDTSLTASAWFQTTEEQFNTNGLVGVESLVTDEVDLVTGSTTGTLTSTAVDFEDGTLGTAWGSFAFNDTESAGDISYSVEYFTDGSSWELIPDTDLSGNSTGYDTSPVNLLGLDTDTYTVIRIVADFTDSGGSPSLQDWTINWGYRVETPTNSKLFPNEKTGTTTPTFEFVTTDPQGDSLTYEISWSTSTSFTASTTRLSSTSAGFVNSEDGGDTDPFNSGETIQFTVQPSDALTDGETYWWRVRATDATGANNFSLWTDAQSFTVATDTIVSTWFQTTEEQFDSNILSGTNALASDEVAVATTASEALIVYGEGTETTPRYREWDGTVWGSEGSLSDVGATIRWSVVRAGTQREEYVAGTIGTDADLNVQVFSTGAWGNLQEMTTNVGDINARGFDITHETLSGDAMVAYCDGDADPSYYIWDGSSWTSGGTINVAETTDCEWIRLASDPVSDEIIILVRGADGNPFEAQVWNGSTWGNSTTLGNITEEDHEGMAIAYEESGGQAVIIASDGAPARFEYDSWDGTAWAGAATQALGDDFEWGDLVVDVGSDELALCYQDEDTNIGMVRWTGSAWAGQTELLTITGKSKVDPGFSCVFEDGGSRDNYIMTVYTDTTVTNYSFWNNSIWSTGAQISSLGDTITSRLTRTGVGLILGTFFDETNDALTFYSWDGTEWSGTTTIEDNASVGTSPFGHPYAIAPRNDGKAGTTIVSPGINFSDGVGPYWEEMSWVDTTPGTSDILYSMQYYNTASSAWQFIPDGDLPGNAVGTSTSPIDLSGLSVSTYSTIRPYAALSCDGSDNCPTLQDWTVKWAEGITVSGTLHEYDQVSSTTVGTVAVAVNGTLQIGKTGSVSGGVWSIPNVTTFAGDIVTVFVSDTGDSTEAVGVTRYDGTGDITGFQLYERHLALGSDDATSTALTNSDIATYNVGNDEDVFMGLSGSSLSVCATTGCADAELFINTNTTYAPGGDVSTHDIENNGTLTATTTLYLTGSWDNNATTTMTNSSVVFEATSTTETVDSTGAITFEFNDITFGTSTGSATWTLSSLLDVSGDITIERGTLARSTEEIQIEGNLVNAANGTWTGVGTTTFDGSGTSNWADQNSNVQNVGDVVIDGSSKTVLLTGDVAANSITIGGDDIFDVSSTNYDVTVYGDWINNNTFAARSGEVFMLGTAAGQLITAGGDAFYDLTFNGIDGDWSFTESTLTVNNDFTVATGTVNMPTATTTLAGSFSAVGGTFAHSNAVIYFTSSGAETIAASGTVFANAFRDLTFEGTGSWTFTDQNATSSGDVRIIQGAVTFPSGNFAVGGSLYDSGGSFAANGGTVEFYSTLPETILAGGSSFNNLTNTGSGSWTFSDTNATITGDLTVDSGTLVLPTGILTIGGSLSNNATLTNSSGEVLFNSTDTGETIALGSSSLYDVTINGDGGGFTITEPATTTNNFTLATSSDFTLASGQTLSVGNMFTNNVGGSSTTWSGSTLSLENGTYSINTKSESGDDYETLRISASTDVSMWNSRATTTTIITGGSLYSQDHAGADGALYIYGSYERTSGTEYWSYATDFDGTDLSGGSERQADVRFASGATASITSATLEILGASSASTTIQNQGSGSYIVDVSAGTTTAQYYDFTDLGSTGLSLLTGNIVTSLADGSFEPTVAAASALTVSSTTIDANPALQIYRVNFATTTAIDATNVTQSDGTPASYWWFRDSYGNLDGENNDADTGNPGSVRWDDSALVVTIGGTVFADDGDTPLTAGTCNGALEPVTIVVEDGSTYTGSCGLFDGVYSISGVTIVGDPTITVYLDDSLNSERAVAVTKTVTADVTDMDLYVNRVITRHEDVDPMTIDDMAAFDSSDDPGDIQFTAATGTTDTLEVFAGNELHVWATTTFTPGGIVTLHGDSQANTYDGTLHIGNDATFTGAGTTTYTVGGSFIVEDGGTYIPASTTVVMNATTTGKTVDGETDEVISFNELQFIGVDGGWNINGNASTTDDIYVATGTVTGTGNITIDDGSFYGDGLVSFGSGGVVIIDTNTLGGTQGWTFNDLTLGTGVMTGTTTPGSNATTTVGGTLTIGTAHFLDAGASSWNLSGSGTVFVENGTFLEDTSRLTYSGTAATDILSTDYYDLVLNAAAGSPTYTATGLGIQILDGFIVGNSATTTINFDTNDTALNIEGDMFIGALGTFIASDSGSFTLAGSYDNDGTFSGNGGTITFDGSGIHTISAGVSDFSSVTINGSGDFTVIEHATATDAWTLTSANDFTLTSGQELAVGGTFTNSIGGADTIWTGSTLRLYGGGNYEINASTTADSYATLDVAAATQIRMWNSDAATTTVSSTGSLYSMDHANTSGELYIFGAYINSGTTDYWSYATDFDGTALGGSSRVVDVFVESGGSVLYQSGGNLQMIGASAASTTVQNQGSGTYGFTVGNGATANFSSYIIRDTDINGLVFTGAPTVTTLSGGDFLVDIDNGSAITVGGTAINANPAKTFTGNSFASSSGILAKNVTATGTAVSSWRFTVHTGNIASEDFDDDPGGNPGYIVWTDSLGLIVISGNVYSDEGVNTSFVCDGSTDRITLVVGGILANATTTSCAGDGAGGGSGAYSMPAVGYTTGDSLVVYIDGVSEFGANVTVEPISSIGNMDIYENRVIVRHEDVNPLTIADMAVWDSSDDVDIPFTAATGTPDTLTLPANTKLIVWDDKEFAPSGNVTIAGGGGGAAYDGTLEIYPNADWTSVAGESHSIGGSLISGAGGTFDAATAAFTFTTTGASRTIDTNDAAFENVTFNGTGSWTINNTTFDANDVTIIDGDMTLPSATSTISGTLDNTGGSFDANGGIVIFDSSVAENIRASSSDFATLTITGSGTFTMQDINATATATTTIESGTLVLPSGTLAVGGDFRNVGGAITHNTSELVLTNIGSATLLASSSDLHSVTAQGGGSYTMEDNSLTLLGSLTVSSGDMTLASGTLSIGGSFDASGGTFDNATGTILFDSTDPGETINPGTSDFYNVNIAGAGGGWTLLSSATTTNNFTLTSANDFTLSSGQTLAVENVFTNSVGGASTTWSGSTLRLTSGTEYAINSKTAGGDEYETLYIGADTDISSWNSQATTTTIEASGSFYSQDHAAVDGNLYIYGDYHIGTTTEYWSYATDFDGTDISGGSERSVTVSLASGATTTVDGGTLNIIGESGNETTITNQGSGTYAFAVNAGTFNATYYAFRNLDASGLNLSGTPSITTLDNGDFELAVAGGNLVSLSSTTLTANASMVITGVRFATTTAITGDNIDLSGTTASAWTFTSHTGNLAGEAYDNDGGDACGSLRWADSACLLTQQTHYRWRNDDGGIDVPDSEWFNADWDARKRVRIENLDNTTYTDAVIELEVIYDSDMQSDFDDLRFTDDSGTTTIPHFIASTTNGVMAEVWVEVPSLLALDTANIFMFYDNALATSTSSSTLTFISADDYEDNNISEYSGETGNFSVDGSFAFGGSYGLDNTGNEGAKSTDGIARFDQTVSQGETIRYMQYVDTTDGDNEVCTMFGVQSPVTNNQNYGVCLEQVIGTDYMAIVEDVVFAATPANTLASTSVTFATGWYEIEVDWDTDDSIFVSLYDDVGTLVATTTATDSSKTSGGYGYTYWFNDGGWDNFSSRPIVTTEPTIRFGVEQTDGGATWSEAQDITEDDFSIGDKARLRFAIENTGLSVSDAYQLEYAEQGAAPSCEAVAPASFAAVEPFSSCGADPICMATSTTVANGAVTTDLLTVDDGDFTSGEFREDPSNTTGSLTVDQNEYTEVEYALQITTNVTDQNLCFRVTDAGTDLDTYLKVARLQVRFDPSFGPVSFNLGQNISLVGGTTTRVYATSSVEDKNGYADLVSGTTTMYTTSATAACTANDNDCYISAGTPQCSFIDCSGDSCTLSCYADFQYHATPTASDAGEEWFAFMEAVDQQGGSNFGTSPGIDLYELRSIDTEALISYGSLEVAQDTGATNASTTVENIGNVPIDVDVDGSDLSDGASSLIPAGQQLFSSTTFTYSSCIGCVAVPTSTPLTVELDLTKPTTTATLIEDDIYWGIAIPFGVASNPHTGNNNFTPIDD